MLVIEKLPGANTVDVTHGVDEALDELAPGLRGITVDRSMFRPATYVEDSGDQRRDGAARRARARRSCSCFSCSSTGGSP